MFLHKGLTSLIWNRSSKREDTTDKKHKLTTVKPTGDIDEKIETKMRPLIERMSRLEQNDINIFKKLDEIMRKIDGLKY